MKNEFAIIFDIPLDKPILKLKVNRALKAIHAKMVQRSIWKSEDFEDLEVILDLIRRHGGKANIIKWEVVK